VKRTLRGPYATSADRTTCDPATLTFPVHLETPEQTIKRFEREQAAYVAKIVTRR